MAARNTLLTSAASQPFVDNLQRARCEPDPLDPDAVLCLARVTTDDRQGISHFFGRNKKATSSIPEDMFPLLCRTHYQEKQYRWKEDPTAFTAFQCDCILKTIERMARKTWTDKDGIEWPYWCAFEVQTSRPKANKDVGSLPDWLRPLCSKTSSGQTFNPIGCRDGVRYSLAQLESLVKSIKSYCVATKSRLPSIEALPLTIGMIDEADLAETKRIFRKANRERILATSELTRYVNSAQIRGEKGKARQQTLERIVAEKAQALEAARAAVAVAQADLELSKDTLPGKRMNKKTKAGSKTPSPLKNMVGGIEVGYSQIEEEEGELEEANEDQAKGSFITLMYDRVAKRLKADDDD